MLLLLSNIMKSQRRPQKPKTRAHRVLFDRDLPFQPKRIELKTRYQRHAKHRNQVDWDLT